MISEMTDKIQTLLEQTAAKDFPIALRMYHEWRVFAERLLPQVHPIGSSVCVGHPEIVATVHGYVEGRPDLILVLFENGNVWTKEVSSILVLKN